MKRCLINECYKQYYAKGYCKSHYTKFCYDYKAEYVRVKNNPQRYKKYQERIKKYQHRVSNTEEFKEKRRIYLREQYKANPQVYKRIKKWKARQPIWKRRLWYKRDNDKRYFGGLKEEVIKRDNYKCVKCGLTRIEHYEKYKRDITVDHINRLGRGVKEKDNRLENLQTLCISCHVRITNFDRYGHSYQI